jgi:hypothetical protein
VLVIVEMPLAYSWANIFVEEKVKEIKTTRLINFDEGLMKV